MSRRQLLLGLICAAAVAGWAAVRPDPRARSADPAFGQNTEDIALARWQTNQSSHWRYVVVQR